MGRKYLQLNDISSYKRAFILSNLVWKIVLTWGVFKKKTVGKQFVKAVDSVLANIAEGFGRFSKKDKIKFYYYSLVSVKESLDWNEKSKRRSLLNSGQYLQILEELQGLAKEIHQLIKFTNEKLTI